MADFLRPEARAALWRGREVIVAGAALVLGLYWALGSYGLMVWFGWVVAAIALAFGVAAVQRMRFAPGTGGPGVVQIDERRLVYFGPLTGGAVALDELNRIDIDRTGTPAHWRLTNSGGEVLHVPLNAEGAEALFDAFNGLPGIRAARIVEASRGKPGIVQTVWIRPGTNSANPHISIAHHDD